MLWKNADYFFIGMGVVWLGVVGLTLSYLLLWPVVVCIVAGVLLKQRPATRLTWSWAVASAFLGLLLAGYEVYAWASYITGAFSALAGEAMAIFGVLTVAQVLLVYAGWTSPKAAKPAQT